MKITIEPTGPDPLEQYGNPYPGVCVWVPGDAHGLEYVLKTLITPALQAIGYSLDGLETTNNQNDETE